MADNLNDAFEQTYNVHSGVDIVAAIGNVVLGNLNGISFSTTREKSPVYTLGSVDAVAFGRGKRGHAGSLIFTNFDRAPLYDLMKNDDDEFKYYKKGTDIPAGGKAMLLSNSGNPMDISSIGESEKTRANYSDQIPPFTITLTGQNEYGKQSIMALLGVELINEGSGISIDDIVTETQMTFVARTILPWAPVESDNIDKSAFGITEDLSTSEYTAIRQAALTNSNDVL